MVVWTNTKSELRRRYDLSSSNSVLYFFKLLCGRNLPNTDQNSSPTAEDCYFPLSNLCRSDTINIETYKPGVMAKNVCSGGERAGEKKIEIMKNKSVKRCDSSV